MQCVSLLTKESHRLLRWEDIVIVSASRLGTSMVCVSYASQKNLRPRLETDGPSTPQLDSVTRFHTKYSIKIKYARDYWVHARTTRLFSLFLSLFLFLLFTMIGLTLHFEHKDGLPGWSHGRRGKVETY
jgi:hypothetical protein